MPAARRERGVGRAAGAQAVVVGVAGDLDQERVAPRPGEQVRRRHGDAGGPGIRRLRCTVVTPPVHRQPVAARQVGESAVVHAGARARVLVEALADERVHAPGRLAGAGEHQHPEAFPQPAPELAQDDEPDALGVLGHSGGVTGLPLDPRVREPAGGELGADHAVGRASAAVLDVDEHRDAPGVARGPDQLEVGRPRLLAVEPDDAVVRAGHARGNTPRALPAAGVDGLPTGDRDPDHPPPCVTLGPGDPIEAAGARC